MRIIQMGMGGMGNAWLERLSPLPFIDFVGFVEVNDTIAQEQATAYELDENIIFKTLPDALSRVEADAVISIIPPEYRIETLQTCIDANLPLMAEKPLSETLEDAYTQARMANESGLMYMITQDYRYKPGLYTVKQILDSGELGAIDAVTVEHYWGFKFTGFRADMPYPLMNDMAVHHFDLLRYFLGSEPTTLYGKSWSPSWNTLSGKMSAHALMTFPEDVHVAYAASWVANGLTTSFDGDWRFDCEKGSLAYVNDMITIQMHDGLHDKNFTYKPSEHRDPIEMAYSRQPYLAHELNEYVVNGTMPKTTVQDNVKTLQMVFDVIESSETGQIIHKDS
ncbi:MAG: Gfo/Idh/MocA family oxidoreductase [Phototrophicaceae bacterium]